MTAHFLAAQLDARRKTLGWSIENLAARTGYHPNTILRVLHGSDMRLRTLVDIAGALGLSVAVFDARPLKPQPMRLRESEEGWTLTSNVSP